MRDAPIQLRSPSGLLIEASTGSSDGVLDQFYQDYDAAFVLENEKEGRAGFVECLALNGGAYPELAARFGAFRELVLVARGSAARGSSSMKCSRGKTFCLISSTAILPILPPTTLSTRTWRPRFAHRSTRYWRNTPMLRSGTSARSMIRTAAEATTSFSPGSRLVDLLLERIERENASLATAKREGRLFLPDTHPPVGPNAYGSCHLPEMIEGFYKELNEAAAAAEAEQAADA